MARKLTLLLGLGAGYVLGARAGRERYDQIAGKAQQLWRDPRVQQKASQAQHLAQEKAGQAQHVAEQKAAQLSDTVKEKAGIAADGGGSTPEGGSGAGALP